MDPTSGRLFPPEERRPLAVAPGAVHLPDFLTATAQRHLVTSCLAWADEAGGFHRPRLPRRGEMSVGIVCLGWHWLPYRYSRTLDDRDGRPVGAFPGWLGELARSAVHAALAVDPAIERGLPLGPRSFEPDVALINQYGPGAKMGMHADREEVVDAPVVSFSLGEQARFRFGHEADRGRPWVDVPLASGDAFVFGGPARRAYHGITKVESSTGPAGLLEPGMRLNVTVRQSGL